MSFLTHGHDDYCVFGDSFETPVPRSLFTIVTTLESLAAVHL